MSFWQKKLLAEFVDLRKAVVEFQKYLLNQTPVTLSPLKCDHDNSKFINKRKVPTMNEQQTDQQIIEFAQLKYPQAENEIVAVDLYAHECYKEIREKHQAGITMKELEEHVEFYGRLVALRITLLNQKIREDSAFEVINK